MQPATGAREVRKESKAKLAAVIKKFTKESVGHQGLWKIATKKSPADDKAQNLPIECEMWPGQPDGLLPIANSNKLKGTATRCQVCHRRKIIRKKCSLHI